MNPTTIRWILQKNLTPPKVLAKIKQTLDAQSVAYQEVLVIPFSEELPAGIDANYFNIFYGSTTLMLNVYKHAVLRNGLFYEPALFAMRNYLAQWGSKMFNVDARFYSFGQLVQQGLPADSRWFIRPDGDTKAFSGTVMSFDEIQAWHSKVAPFEGGSVTSNTEVMIALPRLPEKEWRCFVVNKQITATCRYAQYGELAVNKTDAPAEMLAFIQDCIAQYTPHAIFVMDIALYQGNYYLLECGCMNSTGFYDTDTENVIQAINEHFMTK